MRDCLVTLVVVFAIIFLLVACLRELLVGFACLVYLLVMYLCVNSVVLLDKINIYLCFVGFADLCWICLFGSCCCLGGFGLVSLTLGFGVLRVVG